MDGRFPVTRALLGRLDGWLHRIVAVLPAPVWVAEGSGRFHWEFPVQSPLALMAAKAVRMVSGIRASMALADAGFVTESASLLRITADFSIEIIAIAEGEIKGELTSAQQKFVDQFFAARPTTPAELAAQEKKFYVSREELIKSQVRLANEASLDGEDFRNMIRFLSFGYDAYVHGSYLTAMELFDGDRGRFLTGGVDWSRRICIAQVGVAGKLHEVVAALRFISLAIRDTQLQNELRIAMDQIERCNEQGASC